MVAPCWCWRETREKANESSRNQLTGCQVLDYGRGAIKLEINLTSSQHRRVPDSRAISRCFVVVSNRGYRLGRTRAGVYRADSRLVRRKLKVGPRRGGKRERERWRKGGGRGTIFFHPSLYSSPSSFSFPFLFLFPVFVKPRTMAQCELFGV